MRRRLLIAADVDPLLSERLRADLRFEVTERIVRTEDELIAAAAEAQVLVTRAHNRVTRAVIEAASGLEVIAQGTSGTDNIDLEAARERGITVLSLPGVNANAVAELVIGFMLALTRTVPFYTREVISRRWFRDDCASRHEMRHYRLGIVGLGEVGRRVARLARAFAMDVIAFDPYLEEGEFARRNADRVASLDELLARAGIVTLHAPLNEETRRMIGSQQIAAMEPGAFLINAARGGVIDQQAALEALREGRLGGLALDVFDPEPPADLLPDDPRLILTPHIAGCSDECKREIGLRLYEKLAAWCG